jgi:hypothetical protein
LDTVFGADDRGVRHCGPDDWVSVLRGDGVAPRRSGWACARCHPDPIAPRVAATEPADTTLLDLARRADFPRVPLAPAVTVLPGENAWRRFATAGSAAHRATATAALRVMLGEREPGEQS